MMEILCTQVFDFVCDENGPEQERLEPEPLCICLFSLGHAIKLQSAAYVYKEHSANQCEQRNLILVEAALAHSEYQQ